MTDDAASDYLGREWKRLLDLINRIDNAEIIIKKQIKRSAWWLRGHSQQSAMVNSRFIFHRVGTGDDSAVGDVRN